MPYDGLKAKQARERLAQAMLGSRGQPFQAGSPFGGGGNSPPQTSGYGSRIHPVTQQQSFHRGLDYGAPRGTPIYATAPGYVSRQTSAVASPGEVRGNSVSLTHPGYGETRYEHLLRLSEQALKGGEFKEGDLIGYSGDTGRSSGPHLHYGQFDEAGKPVNPSIAMNLRTREISSLMGPRTSDITGRDNPVGRMVDSMMGKTPPAITGKKPWDVPRKVAGK